MLPSDAGSAAGEARLARAALHEGLHADRAVLGREQRRELLALDLQAGLEVDLAARSVYRAGRPIQLTAREWALFEAFVQRPNVLLSKAQLEERLYSFDAQIESNTIEVYIARLRKKLGADAIETVRGMGYRLGTPGSRT